MPKQVDTTKPVVAVFAHRAKLKAQVSDAGIMHVLVDDGDDAVLFVGAPHMIVRLAGKIMNEVADTAAVWAAQWDDKDPS